MRAGLIPPQAGFLRTLARLLLARHGEDLFRVTVLLPTRRAVQFLRYYLHQESGGRILFPPRLLTLADLVAELAVALEPRPLAPAAERAWHLFRILRGRPGFEKVTPDFARFLPWGLRFVEVLEEFEKEGVDYRGLLYPPEDLPPEGRQFLTELSEIGGRYREALKAAGLDSPAGRLRRVAEGLSRVWNPSGPVYLAGFAALSGSERRLFSGLLAAGAEALFEADPLEIPDFMAEAFRDLKLSPELLARVRRRLPEMEILSAADVHQECQEAAARLPSRVRTPDEVLVLLPVAAHLLPLLYALPEGLAVNITLGYPVRKSLPATFLLLLFELLENRLEDRYPTSLYLALLKHPYTRGIFPDSGLLFEVEAALRRRGSPYVGLAEAEEVARGAAPLRDFHREVLLAFEGVETPRAFSAAVWRVLERVLAPQKKALSEAKENPEILARHFLYTLEAEILPVFEEASFSEEPLGLSALFRMFRELLSSARAPFEGEPLEGIQVMGLLESRLLSFREVLVLDANEGALPSPEEIHPLLPEGVRRALGLPPRARQEALERYYFRRLVLASRKLNLFYLSVADSSPRLPPKVRSRYVEALIWERERAAGRVFSPEDSPVRSLPLRLSAPERVGALPKGEAETREIERLLSGEVSATFLETYLDCPARFYFRYLLRLSPPERIRDYDPAALGTAIHQALEDYFRPYLGRTYHPSKDNDFERLWALFLRALEDEGLTLRLGPERRFFLERTARFRLRQYLSRLEELPPFRILALEEKVSRKHPVLGLTFQGKLDRVDEYETGVVILDYKTGGSVRSLSATRLRELLTEEVPFSPDLEGLSRLRERLPDLQLLLYLFLWEEAQEAAYVHLAEGRKEFLLKPLFGGPPFGNTERALGPEEARRLREEVFPRLLSQLVEHLQKAPAFFIPETPPGCRWCDYLYACPGYRKV
ncbi:hypothetical protein FVE67_07180 [Thermosulfurimonas marina]|uniref:PD-(D/E)XK endonuclease-like domain-containing protein n=1 Tax=Thermosulfurimonas marina TaxID=2047767 RepID=A0A6H1WTT5_9BACT|nr:PD-(D/E)XK nuclease family protein [Thermosulfurimonas marina]QJA06590.1 hypothetical protein FVE67_07180 [Thermosulfurimonas marina]